MQGRHPHNAEDGTAQGWHAFLCMAVPEMKKKPQKQLISKADMFIAG